MAPRDVTGYGGMGRDGRGCVMEVQQVTTRLVYLRVYEDDWRFAMHWAFLALGYLQCPERAPSSPRPRDEDTLEA